MAFWKKSEDPWDIDPEKKRRNAPAVCEQDEPEEEKLGLLDSLRGWNEVRKTEKAVALEKEAAIPPEKCPWCGGDMERGYLCGGRGIWWAPGNPSWGDFLIGPGSKAVQIDVDGGLMSAYKTCWFCETCHKLVVDVPEPSGPNYTYENGRVKLPDTEEDETQE